MHPRRRGGAGAPRAAAAGADRRLGRDRRRLRPDRRDAAAARPARGARRGTCTGSSRWSAGWCKALKPGAQPRGGRADAGGLGLRRDRAAARRARRGARPAGRAGRSSVRLVLTPENVVLAEARRSLHDALALRLPRRRRRRQPGLPRRRCRRLARRLGGGPGRGARPGAISPSPGCRCGVRPTAPANRSAVEALTALAEELYADADPLADPAAHGPLRFARERPRHHAAAGAAPRASARRSTWRAHGDDLVGDRGGRIVGCSRCLRPGASSRRGCSRRDGRAAGAVRGDDRVTNGAGDGAARPRGRLAGRGGGEAARRLSGWAEEQPTSTTWPIGRARSARTCTTTSHRAPRSAPTARSAGRCTLSCATPRPRSARTWPPQAPPWRRRCRLDRCDGGDDRRGGAHRPGSSGSTGRRRLAGGAAAMSLSIGIDVGGTKIAGGVVDEAATILERSARGVAGRRPRAGSSRPSSSLVQRAVRRGTRSTRSGSARPATSTPAARW